MISPSTTPRISVVIASYNGAKYILEQLDSILEQTMKPDEVIIADDCSTDGTFELCGKYINDHNLHGWTVYRNPENLGVIRNFRNALTKAKGDYIFTCDQDDIWVDDKISVMVKAMNERPEILLLVSNYIPFRDGEKINAKVSNINRDDGEIIPIRFKDSLLSNLRPGCTFCFRREILGRFSVMDIAERLHDSMLWKYAVVCDGLYLINRQLILYRRHGSNATNQFNRTPPSVSLRIAGADIDIDMYTRFLNASEGLKIPPENQKVIRNQINFLEKRKKILTKRNPLMTALFVLMNMRHYPTLRNALSDIYAVIKLRE